MNKCISTFIVFISFFLLIAQLPGQDEEDSDESDKWAPEEIEKYKLEMGLSDISTIALNRINNFPTYMVIESSLPEKDIIRLQLENADKTLISFNKDSNKYNRYRIINLEWEKQKTEWNEKGRHKYLIKPPIGSFKEHGGTGQLYKENNYVYLGAMRSISQDLKIPDGEVIRVMLFLDGNVSADNPRTLHELMRFFLPLKPISKKYKGLTVIENEDTNSRDPGYSIGWISDKIAVYIVADYKPWVVIEAYLERYPSRLPEDLAFDRVGWAKMEITLRLKELEKRIENPDGQLMRRPPQQFITALGSLNAFIKTPITPNKYIDEKSGIYLNYVIGKGNPEDFSNCRWDWEGYKKAVVELNRKSFATIEKWAKAPGTEIIWEVKERKFEIRKELPGKKNKDSMTSESKLLTIVIIIGVLVVFLSVILILAMRRLRASRT